MYQTRRPFTPISFAGDVKEEIEAITTKSEIPCVLIHQDKWPHWKNFRILICYLFCYFGRLLTYRIFPCVTLFRCLVLFVCPNWEGFCNINIDQRVIIFNKKYNTQNSNNILCSSLVQSPLYVPLWCFFFLMMNGV